MLEWNRGPGIAGAKRHADIVAEGFRHELQLVAEGFQMQLD